MYALTCLYRRDVQVCTKLKNGVNANDIPLHHTPFPIKFQRPLKAILTYITLNVTVMKTVTKFTVRVLKFYLFNKYISVINNVI